MAGARSVLLSILSAALLAGCSGMPEYVHVQDPSHPKHRTGWRIDPTLRLAVFPFADRSHDITEEPWFSEVRIYLAFVDELSNRYAFEMIDQEMLIDVMGEYGLSKTGIRDDRTVLSIAGDLDARIIISGSFTVIEDTIEINVKIFDVESGEMVAREWVFGASVRAISMTRELARKVLEHFDWGAVGESDLDDGVDKGGQIR